MPKMFTAWIRGRREFETAIRTEAGTLCIIYRATNSFNAVAPGRAVITSAQIVTSDDDNRFLPAWNRRCANKSGTNARHLRYAL